MKKALILLSILCLLISCDEDEQNNSSTNAGESSLGETTESSLEPYYETTAGLTGADLKKALHDIIDDHTKVSYTPGVWNALKDLDEDPGNPNNVIMLYKRTSVPKINQYSGGSCPDCWNREHTWPKSHGFRKESYPAYTDLHHLKPADKTANSSRGTKRL